MTEPLFVIADTYRDAVLYAREHDLGPERHEVWRYLRDLPMAMGRRDGRFVDLCRGACTDREREEQDRIRRQLHMAGFEEVTEP